MKIGLRKQIVVEKGLWRQGLQMLGGVFIAWIIRLCMCTYRLVVLAEEINPYLDLNEGSQPPQHFLSSWHENIWVFVGVNEGLPYRALASKAGGGRFIGQVCRTLGYTMVFGSSTRRGKDKGGARAMIALRRCLQQGHSIAITVDGSVGPRRQAKPGIIELSRRSGTPIVPFSVWCSRSWRLPTWDKLQIPKPFAKVVVRYGKPLKVPSDSVSDRDTQVWIQKLNQCMQDNEAIARSVGLQGGKISAEVAL
ncbi:MAG: lysophospholipid acyltransferase family protein [Zetaproteobacteria bacterium]|nr:lysophospholipid acyltransferase family protein [Zetaproteobacteria bacterium]